MVKPINCCCCCVPSCCGLRGGVLAIAIIQLAVGILGTLVSGLGLASNTTLAVNRALEQNLPVPSAEYVLAVNSLSLISSILQLIAGIVGIQATSNIHEVLSLTPSVVKKARTYWKIYLAIYIIGVVLISLSAIFATFNVYNTYSTYYSTVQLAWAVAWIWVYWVMEVLVMFHFLFVVFSYQKTLALAANGKLGTLPFVVKNRYPTGHPVAPVAGMPVNYDAGTYYDHTYYEPQGAQQYHYEAQGEQQGLQPQQSSCDCSVELQQV